MYSKELFSRQHLQISNISLYYKDLEGSLRLFFNPRSPEYNVRFIGLMTKEVEEIMGLRLTEHSHLTAFSVLAAIEAAFRIDYLQRCDKRKKDELSRAFLKLYAAKGVRASLKNDILQGWKDKSNVPDHIIGDLNGAFNYRDWLAHGRYWKPNLGRKYDYESVYLLAESVFNAFPLYGITA